MAKSFDLRLRKISEHIGKLRLDAPPNMTRQERMEFAQSLMGEIIDENAGLGLGRNYLDRFDQLSDLDKLGVRNIVHGLCQYGCVESKDEVKVLKDWWAATAK